MTTLDTSGVVRIPTGRPGINNHYLWSDLSPFAQGYAEALLGDLSSRLLQPNEDGPCGVEFGFSDLAPETLAMILRDCEGLGSIYSDTTRGGALFWSDRQGGGFLGLNPQTRFPPLRTYLNDAGKVMLEVAS